MGVVFDRGKPEQDEEGGPIFGVTAEGAGWRLRFGQPGPDLRRVSAGDFIWISSDPRVTRAGERAVVAGTQPLGRIGVTLAVRGAVGEPLRVTATTAKQHRAQAESPIPLQAARAGGLTRDLLADKLGSFGGTGTFRGHSTHPALADGLHVPVSVRSNRSAPVRSSPSLDAAGRARVDRTVAADSVLPGPARAHSHAEPAPDAPLLVVPLRARTDARLDAVLDAGAREVELDWMEPRRPWPRSPSRARARGARVVDRHAARAQAGRGQDRRAPLCASRPTACSSATGRSLAVVPRAGPCLGAPRRLLAQRHQLDHRRLGPLARPRHADRGARPRSRSAARLARRGAARSRRGHRASPHPDVPHRALRLRAPPLARRGLSNVRPPVRAAPGGAARSRRPRTRSSSMWAAAIRSSTRRRSQSWPLVPELPLRGVRRLRARASCARPADETRRALHRVQPRSAAGRGVAGRGRSAAGRGARAVRRHARHDAYTSPCCSSRPPS